MELGDHTFSLLGIRRQPDTVPVGRGSDDPSIDVTKKRHSQNAGRPDGQPGRPADSRALNSKIDEPASLFDKLRELKGLRGETMSVDSPALGASALMRPVD